MPLPKTICMLPWISIETSPIGSVRPCCLATDEITKPNGEKFDLNVDTLSTIYRSEYMQDLRKRFRAGEKPETCKRCWEEEDAGRTSKRMHTRVRFKHEVDKVDFANDNPDQLWFVDLKLGNICNLKCRICGSWSSSSWAQEEMGYIKHVPDRKQHIAYTWLQQGQWPRNKNSDTFWNDMKEMLPQVRYFEFTGGEPFMIPEHFELLQYAVDQGYSKNIEIHYNTNGTQWPEKYIHLWQEFKYVEIAFSIDNIGARFEYERFGAKWDEVEENIAKFQALRNRSNNITTQVCMTINTQNVYYLEELCHWVSRQNFNYDYFNMLHDPKHQNIGSMTQAAKDLVIAKLESGSFKTKHKIEINRIIQFIKNGNTGDGNKFLFDMKRADEFRKQRFMTTHPEIARAMGYED